MIMRRFLLTALAVLLSGCQSSEPLPTARQPTAYARHGTACEKADAMWRQKILPSRYAGLPPLQGVGFGDLLALADTAFSLQALTVEGDELAPGRRKRIHAFGAEARLRLEIDPQAAGPYTGVFRSGAACLIGRFSLATRPTPEKSVPGLALKIFVAGDQPSLNLHLMHSVDGQREPGFFAHPLSNVLPPPESFATRLLQRWFAQVAEQFGASDPNPGRLTLDHLAGMTPEGVRVHAPFAPYQIVLRPTAAVRVQLALASAEEDFRIVLARLPAGLPLYEVVARTENEAPERFHPLGTLVLDAPVVASRYGDETLYFQHHMARNPLPKP